MDNAERAKLKARLREQVDEEFAKRAHEHRVKVHTINARRRHRKANKLKAAKNPLDFLAIGDSWFDYPLNDYGIPWPNQDIVAKLQTIGNPRPIALSLAVHGNPMTTTMGLNNQIQYVSNIADSPWANGSPDAILVSGGGDDVVGDQFVIYLDYFGGSLSNRIQGVVDSVEASIRRYSTFVISMRQIRRSSAIATTMRYQTGRESSSRAPGSSRDSTSPIMITRTGSRSSRTPSTASTPC
jgi:hypothetical protein